MKRFILAAFAVLGLVAGAANAAPISHQSANYLQNNAGLMGGGG